MSEVDSSPSSRIEIPGDVLVPDEEFCRDVLNDCTRRTSRRYDAQGLPYILIRGRKFRPLNAGRTWLASRIKVQVVGPQRRSRSSNRGRR